MTFHAVEEFLPTLNAKQCCVGVCVWGGCMGVCGGGSRHCSSSACS